MMSDINNKLNIADERITELENRSTECIQAEREEKKNDQSINNSILEISETSNMYNWRTRRKWDLNGAEKYLLRQELRTF